MRFLSTLASACALVAGAIAAEKPTKERFVQFHRMSNLANPLILNEPSYKSLTAAPRDYSVAVVLTALDPRFGCQLCREFKSEWEVVASSWAKGDWRMQSRLFFGTLDFADGREIFLSVRMESFLDARMSDD